LNGAILSLNKTSQPNQPKKQKEVRIKWDAVDLEVPEIPQKIYDKVKRDAIKNPDEEK
jgi:hypothetical protein